MKIYLHDLIGNHSGVHYYLNTFAKKISKHNIDVRIKSNYSSNEDISYYPNIFRGGLIKRIFLLSYSYVKFFLAICKLKKNEIIIVSLYGTYVDFGLLMISKISSTKVILDVHEVVNDNFKVLIFRSLFKYGFKFCKNPIIGHSKKVITNLYIHGYKNKVIQTPHIHYEIDSSYVLKNVMNDVKKSFRDGFTYFLFFGSIVPSKGIFDLLSAIEKINFNSSKARIIIAGKDLLNNIKDYSNYEEISQKSVLLLKHINDDEMKYLFDKSDYILLPYQDVAQSGVLEMAINFRKPILSSNIKYFKDKFSKYPTFGKSLDTNDSVNFAKAIEVEAKKINQFNFYKDEDLENYFKPHFFNKFIDKIIKNLK